LATYGPIGPALAESIHTFKRNRRAILALFAVSMIASVALTGGVHHWWLQLARDDDRRMNEQLKQLNKNVGLSDNPTEEELASKRAMIPPGPLQYLLLAPLFHEAHRVALHHAVTQATRFFGLGLCMMFLYAAVCGRATMQSPQASTAAMTANRAAHIPVLLSAAAMLFAPALVRHLLGILGAVFAFAIDLDPFHNFALRSLDSWRSVLDAAWFMVVAPFVLPALPLALRSGAHGALAAAARLGRGSYLQLAALISIATAPLVILASISRLPAFGLVHDLYIYDWDGVVDGLLIGPLLAAAAAVAAVIGTYIAARPIDAAGVGDTPAP